MSEESLYDILGVAKDSTSQEIKQAYRKMSLKYHPDKNPGNTEAIGKFQKISEAYETLGDEEKRGEYDMMGQNPFARMAQGGGGNFQNMDDLFGQIFGMPFGMGPGQGQCQGQMNMPFMGMGMGMPFGPGGNVRVFRNGVQVNPGAGGQSFGQALEKPVPIVKNMNITMETVLTGGKIPVEIERWIIEGCNKIFENETIYIEIPKGVDENEMFILRDKGNVISENCRGDIKLFIKINNTTEFKRQGLDLLLEREITLKEALCGFSFEFKYVNGKSYTINNNSGNIIMGGYKKVIPNMGLTREDHTGHLIVCFDVKFPETLTKEQMDKLKEIL